MSARAEWIALYVQDVEEYPEHYKADVREAPAAAARAIAEGLDEDEIRQLIRDLKAERRAVKA